MTIMQMDDKQRVKGISSAFPFTLIILTVIALSLGAGMLIPAITYSKLGRELWTISHDLIGPAFWGSIIGAIVMALIILLRLDELAATFVIVVHLYVDWYLGVPVVGMTVVGEIAALIFLFAFFLARSPRHPWVKPPALWLWILFLVLAIFPAIRGATNFIDAAYYYPNIIFGALTAFCLGTVIARDSASVRRLFSMLAGFATLIAVHTIIEAVMGTALLATQNQQAFLASKSNYQLISGSDIDRVGSFFIDPNWDGVFLGMMLFISLGLFFESSSLPGKALYLAEVFLILPALLFTYSAGAWIAAIAGMITLVIVIGRARYSVLLLLFSIAAAIILIVMFPLQIALLLQHANNPSEASLRIAAWQTAIRVITAFPLAGVGLGLQSYLLDANPYRVPAQFIPLAHPHNSYLELGAMGGLPVLLVFIALLSIALWLALRNWRLADVRTRILLGGGIATVIALSINSLTINGWTLPPLAATGWLILGVISSPLLAQKRKSTSEQVKNNNTTGHF